MERSTLRRLGAFLVAAVLLAALTVATVTPVVAAKKAACQGRIATIVGTDKGDTIYGTNGPDVIAGLGGNDTINGRGGNDIICGGAGRDVLVGAAGRDRLYGNGGPDRLIGGPAADLLFGGVGNDLLLGRTGDDRLNGGPGTDTCYQDAGSGPTVSCELPLPPPPPPPPPPAGPTLIPLTGILAVAFSDIDGLDGYSTGDVLIAKLVDTSGNGQPGAGDSIEMGRYPTNFDASAFGDWNVKTRAVDGLASDGPGYVIVETGADTFQWAALAGFENYAELGTLFQDGLTGYDDFVYATPSSPSAPLTSIAFSEIVRPGDDRFIDVVVNY